MIGYCNNKQREVLSEADCHSCKDVDLTLCRHWKDTDFKENSKKIEILLTFQKTEFIRRAWLDVLDSNPTEEIKKYMANYLFYQFFNSFSSLNQFGGFTFKKIMRTDISFDEIFKNHTSEFILNTYKEFKEIADQGYNYTKYTQLFHKIIQDKIL